MVARSNRGDVRFGNAANPALVPMISGVSSIHSAVACVELYGTVVVYDPPVVVSWITIFHTSELAASSAIDA